ncbi:MAG: patatin-like phospholipase family protein [Candidatus Omnitrophica bacterium]|nr:patatin-like phospholipase family protein [Candidatus Omnitrophota bacterium]
MILFKKRKVALALGGGSARGFANIGVLKVLERHKVPIDTLIGSSIGGLIGASRSLGMSLEEMEEAALKFTWQDITDVTMPKLAIMKGEKLAKTVERFTDHKTFSDCSIPLAITATDIENGDEILFTSGNMQKIIQASCSWPGFFPPVEVDGKFLSDGGVRNSVPVKWAKKLGATFTIAVKLGFAPQKIKADNILQMMIQSIQIMGEELDKYQSMQANIIIEPDLKGINQLDFDKTREIILSGEIAAEREIKKIKRLLRI